MKKTLIKIKRNRLREGFFINMLEKMTVREEPTISPNSIFYEYNGEIILEHNLKSEYLYTHYSLIWEKLKKNFMSEDDAYISDIVAKTVEEYTTIKGVYPINGSMMHTGLIEYDEINKKAYTVK